MSDNLNNNRRIARNTIVLYGRTILVMIVSLYTSRVVLDVLGVTDYGVYDAVGGMVSMLSMISGALSTAISRFLTYELGRGDEDLLSRTFSTSINLLIALSLLILIIGEPLGIWFLNNKMNIPIDRLQSANWVLQCSLLSFVINVISVPYTAAIIAHEKMTAFAYFSIIEVILKLGAVFLLYITLWDKLKLYAILLVFVLLVTRLLSVYYCNRHFKETHYHFVYDNKLFKEMSSFAGWSFFTNMAYVFNTQGVSVLVNIFFGVTASAARGIATQVETALSKFVADFTTALNPQITKLYAANRMEEMHTLVIRGAKFSFFLSLLICLPIILEAETVMRLWLKTPPEYTVVLVRLAIVATIIDRLGNTLTTACMATGNIRKYVIWVTSAGLLAFPLTLLAYKLGASVEWCYIVFALVYILVNVARLCNIRSLLNFPIVRYLKEVIGRSLIVTMLSCITPILLLSFLQASLVRLVIIIIVNTIVTSICTYLFGLDQNERHAIKVSVRTRLNKIISSSK